MEDRNSDLYRIGLGLAAAATLGAAIGAGAVTLAGSPKATYAAVIAGAGAVGITAVRLQRPEPSARRRRRDRWAELALLLGSPFLVVSTLTEADADGVVFVQVVLASACIGSVGAQAATLGAALRRRQKIDFGPAWTIGAGWGTVYGLTAGAAIVLVS
jgi:hypothetical protein